MHTRAHMICLSGGYLPCKKDYKVWYFLHVSLFLNPLYYMYVFLQNLPTMNILDSIFYHMLLL